MIDVEVPILGKVYDFKIEEKETTGIITEEIVRQIREKEAERYGGKDEGFLLCLPEKREILNLGELFASYGITDGTRLLLL